jgi:benzoate-CoA ligase
MLDCNDWPVSFLGAMYAGLVPVAVNTLLTADDYAYMLEHSRAQAVLVSGALLPALTAAHDQVRPRGGRRSSSRARWRRCTRPRSSSRPSWPRQRPCAQAGGHRRRRPGLLALFLGLHRPAQGHGALARQPVLDLRAVRQGRAACVRRRLLLRRQAVLRLRPGQCADLPDERGRHHAADGRAAHARRHLQALAGRVGGVKPTVFYGAPTGFAGMLAHPNLPAAATWRCAWCRRPARRCRPNWASASSATSASTSSTASAPPRCCTSSCPTGPSGCATAPPAGRCPATTSNCAATTAARCPTANRATCTSTAPAPP